MVINSVVRKSGDHVRFVTTSLKNILGSSANTKHNAMMMEDLPMNNDTPVIVIIYIYDEDSGKLTAIVNVYYI